MERKFIQKKYYLSFKENERLKRIVNKLGISESEYIRSLIKGIVPNGKLDENILSIAKSISSISNNINKLVLANLENEYIDINLLRRYIKKLDNLLYEIKKNYLGDSNGNNSSMGN